MTDRNAPTTLVYRVYIKATPDQVWQAITDPEWTNRYGYTGYAEFDLRPGGRYRVIPNPEFKRQAEEFSGQSLDVVTDGEVIEADPPRKLVHTWRLLMDPDMMAEGHTRVTYEITEVAGGVALTLTHELEGAPKTAEMVAGTNIDPASGGGGWPWVLSDLKSLLETGSPLMG
ncbi:MAG: SRPBCC family protein [Acidimicrobiales bacterium]|jgi:uncharacterized protein YndB with AHSA1/START domain|nr:SRPBCC family protein [Acidimicrobiales bacterium]HLV90100.1 SRPBCC family protein [Acidimicrobiia bacterium]